MTTTDPAPLHLQARAGQALTIALDAQPGAGLVWQPPAAPAGCQLTSAGGQSAGAGDGAATVQSFVLTCAGAGQRQLRFELKRPWEIEVRTVQRVIVEVAA